MDNEDLIKLKSYENKRDAEFAKSVLEENGIESILKGDDLYGISNSNIGIYNIYVLKEDFDAAKETIEFIDNPPEEIGSNDIEPPYKKPPKIVAQSTAIYIAIVFLFIGFAIGVKLSDKIKDIFLEKIEKENHNYKNERIVDNRNNNSQSTAKEEDFNKKFDEKMKEPLIVNDEIYEAIVEKDSNCNGIPETFSYYENGEIAKVEIDINEDKNADIISHYKNGIIDKTEIYDKKNRKLIGTIQYLNGLKSIERIDTNKDGIFDQEISYDEYGCFKEMNELK
ncbi:MAG: DUF2007 domain-containing protein [Acidobacteria bacterium]|nr:DUF2007 domain-containing protein [Acidobacteriota bacterium]